MSGGEPTREQLEDWLVANCGKGLPHGDAKDRAGMLHGLAYVLRQIEGTTSYKVNIGQCNSATSALRMALEHFAREALTTPPARTYAEGVEDSAKVADDAGEGSRVLHNLAAKDKDRDGCNIHAEGWRTGKQIAAAIRALATSRSQHEGASS